MNVIIKSEAPEEVELAFYPRRVKRIDAQTCSTPFSWCREELVWFLGKASRNLLARGTTGTITLEGVLSHQNKEAYSTCNFNEPSDFNIAFFGLEPKIDEDMRALFDLCCYLIHIGLSLYLPPNLIIFNSYSSVPTPPIPNKIKLEVDFPEQAPDWKFGSITNIPLEWCTRHYILSLLVEIPRIWLKTSLCKLDLQLLFGSSTVRRLPRMHLQWVFHSLIAYYLPALLFTGGTWQFWNIIGVLCHYAGKELPEDAESSGYRTFLHKQYSLEGATAMDSLFEGFSTKDVLAFTRLRYPGAKEL